MTYNFSPGFNVDLYAQARVDTAASFREAVVNLYKSSYENFWCLGRTEVSKEDLQATLNRIGPTLFQILQDSATFVTAITTAFPEDLPEKYQSSPYEWEQVDGQLLLGELKDTWKPEAQNEPTNDD